MNEGKRTIGLFRNIWRYITKVKPAEKQQTRELVGIDKKGNKYYITPADKSITGRETRTIETAKLIEDKHDFITMYGVDSEVPIEWNSWLRGTRKFPPTEKEIERNEINKIKMAEKVRRLEMKEAAKNLGLQPEEVSDVSAITKDLSKEMSRDQPNKVPFPKYGDEFETAPGYSKSGNKEND